MSNQNKTREELIFELQELKQKYDSLQELYTPVSKKPKKSDNTPFNQKADALLMKRSESTSDFSEADTLKLIHELEVHQIELKLQNEELLQANKKTAAVEDKFAKLYAFAPSGYYTLDDHGIIIEANLNGTNLLVKKRSSIINRSFRNFITPATKTIFDQFFKRLFKTNKTETCNVTLSASDGRQVSALLSGIVNEQPGQCLLAITDISELALANEKLQQKEVQYKSLFENNHSVMLLINPETSEIIDANTAAIKYYGWSYTEICAKKIFEINTLSEKELKAEMQKAKEEKRKQFYFKHRLANGEVRHVEEYSGPIQIGTTTLLYSLVHDITDRRTAEEKLQVSEGKFRSIFENMLDCYYEATLDGILLEISPSIELITKGQYKRDELIGQSFVELYAEKDARTAFYAEISRSGKVTDYELLLTNRDGTVLQCAISSAIYYDAKGNPVKISGILRDISERKKAEEKMKKRSGELAIANHQLAMAQQIGNTGSWSYNLKTRELKGSMESLHLFGLGDNLEDFNVENVENCITEKESVVKASHELLEKGIPYNLEYEIHPADGSTARIITSKAELKRDNNGNPVEIYGVFQNITDRKLAENKLIQNEEKYRFIAERSNDLIYVYNLKPTSGFEYVSPSALKITGYTPEEHYTDPMLGLKMIHPDDRHLLQAQQKGIINPEPEKLRWIKKDGSIIWMESQTIPIFNKEGEFIAFQGKAHEITERIQSEQILEARLRLTEFAQLHTRDELQQKLLDELETLTNSHIGFFHAVDADQKTLTLQSWSTNTLQAMCTAESSSQHYGLDKAGVWVDCVRQRKAIIHNDYMSLEHRQGLPEGHASVIRELVVPVFRNNLVAAIVGIGNKSTDYTEKDIYIVILLADLIWDITERKGAEENMKKLSQAIEQSPVMTYIANLSGEIEYVNPKIIEITGYSKEELIGSNPRIFSSGQTSRELYTDLWETIRSGNEWKGEFNNKKKKGEYYWVSSSVSPVINSGGNITHYLAIQEDITQRKEAEKEILELNESLERKVDERTKQLQEALSRLNKIADRVPGMVYQYQLRPDGTSCFPYTSEGIRSIYGVSPEEVSKDASCVFAILHPDDLDGVAESIQASANKLELWSNEYRVKHQDGTIRWLWGNAMPERGADGSVLWHGFIRDITERKETEAALAIEKQRLVSILEGTNVGTWEWNIKTGENIVNERWAEIIGYSLDELSPVSIDTWLNLIHPDDSNITVEHLKKHFKKGDDYFAAEFRMKHKNGSWIWVFDKGKISKWDIESNPLLMSGTLQDITLRKESEEALRESQEQLDLVIKGSNDAPWDWNLITNKLYYSQKWWQQLGYKPEEIPSDSSLWRNLTHPEDMLRVNDILTKALESVNESYEAEFRLLHKNGRYVPVLSRGFITRDPEGKPIRVTGTNMDLTERKEAEELLRASEIRHSSMISNISDVIGIMTADGIMKYKSPNIEKYFGWNPNDLVGTNGWLTVHPEDLERIQREFYSLLGKDKAALTVEYKYKCKDGSYKPIELTATNLINDPVINGILLNYHDITERKRAQDELHWNQSLLNYMSNASPLGFLVVDNRTDDILYFNRRFCEIWEIEPFEEQMKRGELKNNDIIPYCLPVLADIPAFAESCKPLQFEDNRVVIEDEIAFTENRTVRRFSTQIRGAGDEYYGRFYIFEDITGRKRSEEALKESESRFSLFMDYLPAVVFMKDHQGKTLYVNKYMDEAFGASAWQDKTMLEVFPNELGEKLMKDDIDSMELGYQKIEESLVQLDGKLHYYETQKFTIDRLEKESWLGGVSLDITERKLAEAEILKAKSEAENANRAKSEFLSRMSHELRTPMNSILGFAQLMEMGELNPKQKIGVNHIINSGKHLLELINEVLDISRIEAGRQILTLEPIQLSAIINEITDSIQVAANKRNVSVQFVNTLVNNPFAFADRLRLKQVLINLLNNAIKYNREGGSVWIKTTLQPANEMGNTQVRISITDTGNGINPDDIGKLFHAFERIGADKTETEGTGLGLMLVKKLTEAMGGSVGVESEVSTGSTFWIELPVPQSLREEISQSTVEPTQEINSPRQTGTILYIEDNLSNIELVEAIIEENRPEIHLVTSIFGKQAILLAKKHKPGLILLDLDLPDIKGNEVLELLMEDTITKAIPVIILSADAMPFQLEKLIHLGAKDYLTKPMDVVNFLKIIDRHIKN